MMETQHPAKALSAFDCTEGRFGTLIGYDELVVESLVMLAIVVRPTR
jgi:hypothetical protein